MSIGKGRKSYRKPHVLCVLLKECLIGFGAVQRSSKNIGFRGSPPDLREDHGWIYVALWARQYLRDTQTGRRKNEPEKNSYLYEEEFLERSGRRAAVKTEGGS